MKKCFLSLVCILVHVVVALAQNCPAEWRQYTGVGYISDVQQGYNNQGMTEVAYKNYLSDIARANLARQLEVKVRDFATTTRAAVNGDVSIGYQSSTNFSTELNLKYVKTLAKYNPLTREGYAIAFIDKSSAIRSYKNEIELIVSRADNALKTATSYKSSGFKNKAREELAEVLPEFNRTEDLFFALTFLDESSNYRTLQSRCSALQRKIKQMLADLKHATVVYVKCKADMFGMQYNSLLNEIKGVLSAKGCSFTADAANADYSVEVDASAREHAHSTYGSTTTYFAYVDASIKIYKVITSQRIYEDEIMVKGGSINYKAAARDAYKKVSKAVGDAISDNIEL